MAEIGTRKKRTLQGLLQEPSRQPIHMPVPEKQPRRKEKTPA